MTLAQLRANRGVWHVREDSYYKKWWTARYHPNTKQNKAYIMSRRDYWWKKYVTSRDRRHWYDIEIAKHLSHEHGEAVSAHGVAFIAGFEGYEGHVYNDGTGVMTVGYGHVENVPGNGWWVAGQKQHNFLSQPEAMRLLKDDLNKHYVPYVKALFLPLSQNAFDGWVSFVYNVGPGGISNNSEVGRLLKGYHFAAATNAMLQWDHAGGQVLEGLRRRREAERHLILS